MWSSMLFWACLYGYVILVVVDLIALRLGELGWGCGLSWDEEYLGGQSVAER